MKKKIGILSLLFLLANTLVIPVNNVSYANSTNGITINDDGSRTLKYNNIEITVAASNLEGPSNGRYFWGNNEKSANNNDLDNNGEEHNNNWGGAEDSEDNGYNAGWNQKRQGPCPEGWHVPSKGEWYDLSISWCKLDETCSEHLDQVNGNIYAVQRYPDGANFGTALGLNYNDGGYWTSTPSGTESAYSFSFDGGTVNRQGIDSRSFRYYVRCFKNPQTTFSLTYRNKSDKTIIGDTIEDIRNGTIINEEMLPEQATGYTNHYYLTGDDWTEIENILGYEITEDIDIYVESVPNKDTPYKAEHYKENLEGEFEFIETGDYMGTTNTLVTGEYNIYEGFTGLEIEAKNLLGDGSTVVIINYSRNSHNLTIDGNTTEIKYGAEIVLKEGTKEGYHFVEWQGLPEISGDNKYYMPDENVNIIGIREKNSDPAPQYSGGGGKKSSGGGSIKSSRHSNNSNSQAHEVADDESIIQSKRKGSEGSNNSETLMDSSTEPQNNKEYTQNSSDKYSEGQITKTTIKNTEIIATVKSTTTSNSSSYTKEENEAYSFAKSNGITTTSSIETAKMNTELTRIQMAKMLSNYAINVLGQKPDVSKGTVKFSDVTNKMDKQYDNAVTLAYQLGIMGQNVKNNEFRPNDKVTRAEFSTALSRLLYKTDEGKYKGTGKYYETHITKLYNEGIINKADPSLKEKRGYVMTMLKRTVE